MILTIYGRGSYISAKNQQTGKASPVKVAEIEDMEISERGSLGSCQSNEIQDNWAFSAYFSGQRRVGDCEKDFGERRCESGDIG